MKCKVSQVGDHYTCEFCGYTHDIPFNRTCPLAGRSLNIKDHRGLGDTFGAYAYHFGWAAAPSCDCEWRRTFLNKLVPYEPKMALRNLWVVFWVLLLPVAVLLSLPVVLVRWWTVVPETDADRVAKRRAAHEAGRKRRSLESSAGG